MREHGHFRPFESLEDDDSLSGTTWIVRGKVAFGILQALRRPSFAFSTVSPRFSKCSSQL